MKQPILLLFFLLSGFSLMAQVNFENKYSTFGILAVDTLENTWGCAFATNNIAIGQAGVYEIAPGKGIIASIAYTNPEYPMQGIKMLKNGKSLRSVFKTISSDDNYLYYRQVALLDSMGNTLGYTGNTIKSLSNAGTINGKGYIVLGNSVSNDTVLHYMEKQFLSTSAPLYQRLLIALKAGQEAGGQATGKMSASICVKKTDQVGFNEIDYRVDFSKTPFKDLESLVNNKTGIDLLIRANNTHRQDSAQQLLDDATVLLEGWTMLYPELAKAYYSNGYEEKAVDLLAQRLEKDSLFVGFLPSCYFLHENERYQQLISEYKFGLHDWLEAMNALIEYDMDKEAVKISNKIIDTYPDCSYLHYLTGRAHENLIEDKRALKHYRTAISLDNDNIEAINALRHLNNQLNSD